MLEHRLDRLAGDVGAWRSLAEALGPRVVADAHDDGVGPAPLGGAVAEGLDERDAERVERRTDEPHRGVPAAVASRKERRVNTFSRSVISTLGRSCASGDRE